MNGKREAGSGKEKLKKLNFFSQSKWPRKAARGELVEP